MIYSVMLKEDQRNLPDRIKHLAYKMSAENGKKVNQGTVLEMAVKALEEQTDGQD